MIKIGDRVHAKPAPGEAVQRGRDLFGQFLPPDGAEVVWDAYHQLRLQDGSLLLPPEHYHRPRLTAECERAAERERELLAQAAALKAQGAKADPKAAEACAKALEACQAEKKRLSAELEALGKSKKSTGGEG